MELEGEEEVAVHRQLEGGDNHICLLLKEKSFIFYINMFFPMTPEMIKHLNDIKKKVPNVKAPNVKAPMTFESYYNKRFMEECKYFVENPKFSMKYAMIMSYLQKDIREKALKEYKEKWPGSPIDQSTNTIQIALPVQPLEQAHDTESVISDYDIIDEDDVNSVQSVQSEFEDLEPEKVTTNLRRSNRLLKSSNK
jgi:hypothetical protein